MPSTPIGPDNLPREATPTVKTAPSGIDDDTLRTIVDDITATDLLDQLHRLHLLSSNESNEGNESKSGTSKSSHDVNNSLTLPTHPQSVAACPVGGGSAAVI